MRTRERCDERGFTLMETMVSFSIFAVVASSMTAAFVKQTRFNTLSEQQTQAMSAAQRVLDELRFDDPTSLPSSGSTARQVVLGNRTFDVQLSYCENPSFCTSNAVRHIVARVSLRGTQLYSVETVYAQLR